MPIFVVTGPDGHEYEVNAPEGASEQDVLAYAQQNYHSAAPSQPQRSALQQAGHEVSMGTRATLEGLGGFADVVVDPLARGLEAITGHPMYNGRDVGRMASDALGLDTPESGSERVVSDVNRAVAGTVGALGAARAIPQTAGPVLQGVRTFFGAQPRMQAAGAATGAAAAGITRESGGGDNAQMTAGIVGSLIPGVGTYGVAGATRRALRGDGGDVYTPGELAAMGYQKGDIAENALAQLIAFRRAGIQNPTVGQIGQTLFARTAESALSQFPGSAGIFAENARGQIDDATRTIAGMTGRAGPTTAGAAIRQGQQDFGLRLRDVADRVYAPVDAAMAGQPVQIDNTLAALARSANPVPSAPAVSGELGNRKLGNVLTALLADSRHSPQFPGVAPQRTIPFEALKAQRSAVGELIGDSATRDVGAGPRQLRGAYGAMSADMEAGARAVGPQAEAALARANRVHATGMQRDAVLRDVVGDRDAEQIFRRAVSGSADGGTELASLMKSLKPEQRSEVAKAMIREMGWVAKGAQDSTGNTFSAVTFKNNWANLSDEAKAALFDHLPKADRQRLQAMADVGQNIQEGSRVFANPSGTAGKSALYSIATAAGTLGMTGNIIPALGVASSPLLAMLAGKAATSPAAVRWMTRRTALPIGALPATVQANSETRRKKP